MKYDHTVRHSWIKHKNPNERKYFQTLVKATNGPDVITESSRRTSVQLILGENDTITLNFHYLSEGSSSFFSRSPRPALPATALQPPPPLSCLRMGKAGTSCSSDWASWLKAYSNEHKPQPKQSSVTRAKRRISARGPGYRKRPGPNRERKRRQRGLQRELGAGATRRRLRRRAEATPPPAPRMGGRQRKLVGAGRIRVGGKLGLEAPGGGNCGLAGEV